MNFDHVALCYRHLEHLAFGHYLEQCRSALLPRLSPSPRKALLIGEGDGRFLQQFLKNFPGTEVDVVEASERMVELAKRRAARGPDGRRVRFLATDILAEGVPESGYDLVVTHFFVDVLTEAELLSLAESIRHAAPKAHWLISEFQVCRSSALAHYASRLCLKCMYVFFRLTAGVKVSSIPDYEAVFTGAGMKLCAKVTALGGFLSSELWQVS